MVGILAGLTAALAWTVASSLWRGLSTSLTALQLNGLKNAIACVVLLPVLITIPWGEHPQAWLVLLLSGTVGIALGDSFYLAALRRLGTRRALTVEALAPLVAAISGLVWMGEAVSAATWAGASLVSASVLIVARQRPPEHTPAADRQGANQLLGIGLALLAVACGVGGAALSRSMLISTTVPPTAKRCREAAGGMARTVALADLALATTLAQSKTSRPPTRTATDTDGDHRHRAGHQSRHPSAANRAATAAARRRRHTAEHAPVMALLVAKSEEDKPQVAGLAASFLAVGGVALAMLN